VDRVNQSQAAARSSRISAATILLLAASCGLIVANIYYAQPLIGPIAASLGLARQAAGLIVTMTQIGYGAGLAFLVPLGDLVENRKIVIVCIALCAMALASATLAGSSAAFLASAFAIGLGSAAVQIIVPLAAHLAPDAIRGRIVGAVMSGLMIGIMAARPVASFIASQSSWRTVFALSAGLMAALGLVLSRMLPVHEPKASMSYFGLLASMGRLAAATPILRLRAFYQSCLFAAFSLFWTTTPLLLAGPDYRLTQRGIALFALAGVSGAVAAPIAGRLADRGFSRPATGAAIVLVALAFLATMTGQGSTRALAVLVVAAVAVDFGVQANVVLGLRAIFALAPEARGRLNGIYIATFFLAGALGSAVGAWAYAEGGWTLASRIGLALPLIALARFVFRLAMGQGAPLLPPR
jgi:predicted MFS family arabinose efflux permease